MRSSFRIEGAEEKYLEAVSRHDATATSGVQRGALSVSWTLTPTELAETEIRLNPK